jgi:hypothetical protein
MKLKSTRFIPVSSTDLSGAAAYDDQRIGLKDYGSFSDTAMLLQQFGQDR